MLSFFRIYDSLNRFLKCHPYLEAVFLAPIELFLYKEITQIHPNNEEGALNFSLKGQIEISQMPKTQFNNWCLLFEAARNLCFNRIGQIFKISERRLQIILVATYLEKLGLNDWAVSDLSQSITEIQESNLYGRLYELIEEECIEKVSRGRFKCADKANRIALSYQNRFTQEANKLIEKGIILC